MHLTASIHERRAARSALQKELLLNNNLMVRMMMMIMTLVVAVSSVDRSGCCHVAAAFVPSFRRASAMSRIPQVGVGGGGGGAEPNGPSSDTTATTSTTTVLMDDDEDAPAGIVGAEFFGGNKQKEELYDPIAEAQADLFLLGREGTAQQERGTYSRFDDARAFPDDTARELAESLQQQVTALLYNQQQQEQPDAPATSVFRYSDATTTTSSSQLQWTCPFPKTKNHHTPLQELQVAKDFYRHLDLAIVAGRSVSACTADLRWELSVAWPTFWEPRAVLTGTSRIAWKDGSTIKEIVQQVDVLDQPDLLSTIANQILPRFWDTYHIGMTPCAERQPASMAASTSLFAKYKLYTLPPRLVYTPSILDTGSREDANALTIPNHAFATVIKTMGPKKQRYVTTTPVQVQLQRGKDSNSATAAARLQWTIPVSVELQAAAKLPLPGEDPETLPEFEPEATFEFQTKRNVATLPYGGSPQDVEVAAIRKELYEQVVRDGYKPKLDEAGRPIFFFWQNNLKACYTEGGLGMAVYEWRPNFVKANEVGIELTMDDSLVVT